MKIPFFVTLVHVALVAAAIYIQPKPLKMSPHHTVKVKTIVLPKEQFQIAQIPTEAPATPNPEPEAEEEDIGALKPSPPPPKIPRRHGITEPAHPTQKPLPTQKPESNPSVPPPLPPGSITQKEPKKKNTPKKEVAKKSSSPSTPQREKLISMMEKSLKNMPGGASKSSSSGNSKKGTGKTTTGKVIGTLASEALSFEARYEEELVPYLESLLSLPEKGEVKIKLTLKREGNVQKMEIIKASSERNRTYIANSLTSLSFPPFGTHFKGESSHTFTLNLKSENSR